MGKVAAKPTDEEITVCVSSSPSPHPPQAVPLDVLLAKLDATCGRTPLGKAT